MCNNVQQGYRALPPRRYRKFYNHTCPKQAEPKSAHKQLLAILVAGGWIHRSSPTLEHKPTQAWLDGVLGQAQTSQLIARLPTDKGMQAQLHNGVQHIYSLLTSMAVGKGAQDTNYLQYVRQRCTAGPLHATIVWVKFYRAQHNVNVVARRVQAGFMPNRGAGTASS